MRPLTRQPAARRRDSRQGIRVVAVTSGKGGVGKTQIAVNLAVALAQQGRQTLLLDADLGLANVDVLLGLSPRANLEQVVDGTLTLDDVLIELPCGLGIVPAASGVAKLANLSPQAQYGLINAFSGLAVDIDTMIVDTATGASHGVLGFCSAASEVLIVLCDEPASLTDSYALVKLLRRDRGVTRFQVLCNRVRNGTHGRLLFEKFCAVCDRFLDTSLCHIGNIPEDRAFSRAAQLQKALVECYPSSNAGSALKELAGRADSWNALDVSAGRPMFFLERALASARNEPAEEAC